MPASGAREEQRPPGRPPSRAWLSRRQFVAGVAGWPRPAAYARRGGGGTPPAPSGAAAAQRPRAGRRSRGGDFRLGVTGGGSKDIMDGQNIVTKPDQARLVTRVRDAADVRRRTTSCQPTAWPRASRPDNPKQYTIKLRKGIEFQNGKTLTADDVIYSLQRIGTQKQRPDRVRRHGDDGHQGHQEDGQVHRPAAAADPGLDDPADAGQLHLRHRARRATRRSAATPRRRSAPAPTSSRASRPASRASTSATRTTGAAAQPYFDTVTITDFTDATAQVNALLGGQIDAMTDLPAVAGRRRCKAQGVGALISKTGGWLPLCMAIDMPPFDDAGSGRRCG